QGYVAFPVIISIVSTALKAQFEEIGSCIRRRSVECTVPSFIRVLATEYPLSEAIIYGQRKHTDFTAGGYAGLQHIIKPVVIRAESIRHKEMAIADFGPDVYAIACTAWRLRYCY